MAFNSKIDFRQFNDVQDIQVPKFSACSRGKFAQVTFNHKRHYNEKLFNVFIFSCGHYLDNEDYISILITQPAFIMGMDYDSVAWTFSVIDVCGTKCFLQCFTKDDFLFLNKDFGLIRFLRRHALLDRKEEFLLNDVLILRCEVTYISQIGPDAEGKFFFVYASKEELNEAHENGIREIDFRNNLHVVIQSKEYKEKGKLRKQFFELVDFEYIFQVLKSGSNWSEEDFATALNKRQCEIETFFQIFWKSNLFCASNECYIENSVLQFLTVKRWVEDVSLQFIVQESNLTNLHRELQTNRPTEVTFNDLSQMDKEVFPIICDMFQWNNIFHQSFEAIEERQEWEQKLENLRYETYIALENNIHKLFQFQFGLRDIEKESKVDIQFCSQKQRMPFLLILYCCLIFLISLYFFETALLETFLYVLFFFFAVLYMHTSEDEEERAQEDDEERTQEDDEERTQKDEEKKIENVTDNSTGFSIVIETKDCKFHLIPFKNGVETLGSQLRAASPVFDRMLAIPMKEKLDRTVKLENINSICLDNFLYFLKTRKLKIGTLKDILDLYEMADEFAVIDLMRTCAENITHFMTIENIDEIRAHATLHNDSYLLKLADEFLDKQEYLTNFIYH